MTPYYSRNGITIYCGDNVTTMRKVIDDDSIDLTVTSPPYDNLRDYNGYTWDFEGVAGELWRVTKPGGVVVWVVGDATINGSETGTSFRQALGFMGLGFRLHSTMIWNKGTFISPQELRYPNSFEYMFVLSKGSVNTCNQIIDRKNAKAGSSSIRTIRKQDGTTRNMYADCRKTTIGEYGVRFNVWDVWPEQSSKNRLHPAPFPEALARDHIISWSNPGDLVFDPFLGSGTTAKMAQQQGRRAIGIELSEDYCKIAVDRLRQPSFFSIPDEPKDGPEQLGF